MTVVEKRSGSDICTIGILKPSWIVLLCYTFKN